MIKIIKKDYQKKLVKDVRVLLKKNNKKVAKWSWTIQTSLGRWETKTDWFLKKHSKMRKKALL